MAIKVGIGMELIIINVSNSITIYSRFMISIGIMSLILIGRINLCYNFGNFGITMYGLRVRPPYG